MKNSILFFCIMLFLMSFLIACAPAQQQPAEQAPIVVEKPTNAQSIDETPKTEEKIKQAKVEEPEKTAITPKIINVAIRSFKFVPADAVVNVGDTVIWTNEDSAPHTVESSDNTLRSDELSKGDIYSFTFTKSGKYSYICGIHPSMKGSITVQ